MKKNILLAIIFMFAISVASAAGPFGLEMGMSLQQVKNACGGTEPRLIDADRYYVEPLQKHSAFESYIAWIDAKEGLYYLKAIGKDITTSRYGTALKSQFDKLEESISKTYGKNNRYDFLSPGSIWDEPEDFMMGLVKEERVLDTYWDKEEGSTLSNNIVSICLYAKGTSANKGYINLEYEFSNYSAISTRKKQQEDSVF